MTYGIRDKGNEPPSVSFEDNHRQVNEAYLLGLNDAPINHTIAIIVTSATILSAVYLLLPVFYSLINNCPVGGQ